MEFEKTERNKVKRVPSRGHYDKQSVYEILDAGFVCHLGFEVDGQPYVIPTSYGRDGDIIYVHGATKSRLMLNMKKGIPVCLTVTHIDGIVLARSAFHHSMNYRSAIVFGTAREMSEEEKEHGLFMISENILQDRWEESRKPTPNELKATTVLRLEIEQASAKIRTGGPVDEPVDYELPIWAGVVPFETKILSPKPDDRLHEQATMAESVRKLMSNGV
ncbi:pyridoxamine 5'-phosphate oxidase family protein [Fulvivirgaceae bacterium BMA10]|uniref:Pyridoxamine 5'-phosphate oxidase family protein n=1 Tax=Splendidivirga corallicola TaxID=3051826 RepID=A0ABT8KWX7_9BACT|nr:pyridoxamine 5'-phosphate oxidase family protein [Fulvivirgaceae bacterium BMA10]